MTLVDIMTMQVKRRVETKMQELSELKKQRPFNVAEFRRWENEWVDLQIDCMEVALGKISESDEEGQHSNDLALLMRISESLRTMRRRAR